MQDLILGTLLTHRRNEHMSQAKQKLVFKTEVAPNIEMGFKLVKATNTLNFGVPGESLSKEQINRIMIDEKAQIRSGKLVLEFVT